MPSFRPGSFVFGSYWQGVTGGCHSKTTKVHVTLFVPWLTSQSPQMLEVPPAGRVTGISCDTSGPLCQWSICIRPTCHLLAPCLVIWRLANARGATYRCGYNRSLSTPLGVSLPLTSNTIPYCCPICQNAAVINPSLVGVTVGPLVCVCILVVVVVAVAVVSLSSSKRWPRRPGAA